MSTTLSTTVSTTANLFKPFTVNKLEIPNRLAMAPMTRCFCPDNVPTDEVAEYYARRAAGGIGLIITEGTCIGHKAAAGYPNVPFIAGEEALAGWKKVVDAVHAAGGKIAPQLWHVGSARRPGVEPGGDTPGYSPSGMGMPGKVTGHAMTKEDIDEVVAAFAQAAKDAKAVGFDAVEIHGAHGYLIDQFFWEGTNQRDDEYGGDLAQRSRFGIEVVSAIRAAVGPDFPIILRWSQWKLQNYTAKLVNTPEELEAFLKPLSDAGVDVFHCSVRRFWEPAFEGSDLTLAGWVKKLTGKPVIAVGSVGLDGEFRPNKDLTDYGSGDPASLDELMRRVDADEFDMVAIGRALLSNPEWGNHVRNEDFGKLVAYDKSYNSSLI